jgi:hypothetical protein
MGRWRHLNHMIFGISRFGRVDQMMIEIPVKNEPEIFMQRFKVDSVLLFKSRSSKQPKNRSFIIYCVAAGCY